MPLSFSLRGEAKFKQQLSEKNPLLSPDRLSQIFPEYADFDRNLDRFGIWQHQDFSKKFPKKSKNKNKNFTEKRQAKKVLLLLSGIAGGGKDAIREEIQRLYPKSIFKIITATSRQPREGEQHGVDYYFYDSKEEFKAAINENQFLEWVTQGDRLYGSPKISFFDALKRPEPIMVTHVEMTAWPKVTEFIQKEVAPEDQPIILKVFALPHLKFQTYSQNWLKEQRPDDYQARLTRTIWELATAPSQAELLISNYIDQKTPFLTWQTKSLLRIVQKFLIKTTQFKI